MAEKQVNVNEEDFEDILRFLFFLMDREHLEPWQLNTAEGKSLQTILSDAGYTGAVVH